MLEYPRYPTTEGLELLMARARQMRSEYMGMLVTHAKLRAMQYFLGDGRRKVTGAQRFYFDVG